MLGEFYIDSHWGWMNRKKEEKEMNKEKDEVKDKVREVSLLPGYVNPVVKCVGCLRIVPVSVLEKTGWRCPHDDCGQMLKLVAVWE